MQTQSAVELFIRRICSRSVLTEQEIDALSTLSGRMVVAPRGDDLVLPGHAVTYSTLVVRGLLARFDQMADGKRQITALHIPGDMADLHSLPSPMPAWGIQALVPSTVLQVPHSSLERLLSAFPNLTLAFWRDTVVDASVLAKWTANIGRADAMTRTAHLLCELGVRMEAQGLASRTNFPVAFTQAQLADALGLTTVHINRTIAALRVACGLLIEKGRVGIQDWNRLASHANFDASYLFVDLPDSAGQSYQ